MTPVKFIVNFNHFRDQKNSKSSSTKILGRQLREHTVDSLKGHAAKECFVESCQLLHIVWNVLWNFISLTLSPFWQTLLDAHTVQLQLQLPNYVTGLVNLSISLKFTLAAKKAWHWKFRIIYFHYVWCAYGQVYIWTRVFEVVTIGYLGISTTQAI